MKLAIIGRTEWLYETALLLRQHGHEIGLVVTSREAPEYTRGCDDFRRLAEQCGARFAYGAALDASPVVEALDAAGPMDLGISVNCASIISQPVIDRFRLGILNGHGGDLPRYRGNAGQAWAMLNGESRIGLCIHRMVGGQLDAGDIVARRYRPLALDDRIGDVLQWIGEGIPPLFLEAVTRLSADPSFVLERQSTNPADALRCYPRTPDDGRIDWSRSSEDVLRLINASSEPFQGAFCTYDGARLTIWRARLFEDEERYFAVPGQVAAICDADGSIVVICGSGKLRITDVSHNGKRLQPATLIRSTRSRLT